ncbi:hypothetical protein [Candidatus Thiodictyon syntrophicum]|jgi:hypothetical protein|uniref:PBS lyase n=1 Tax=Candidatus Thiodictyon syntrophicum TaxID=1166950 RepID=A0A2K8U306_9GAMM|nr:hypothetical protein [Candidatus Thiodictyon syntrophicum]AUB79968.1 hypothetical protein THSYN_02640 [Candidatus Thiodictyon syntrophicum]
MAKRRIDADNRLTERLAGLRTAVADGGATLETLRPALADPNYRLVAAAAGYAGDGLLYPLEPDLIAAFRRLADGPHTQDPQCTAKGAIARALVALDCANVEFFLTGIRLRQLEPAWGGSQDTALDCRVSCAMGLAATAYARALPELIRLLADPEPRVRAGVMDAIACCEPIAAESVLRTKAQCGDPEPEVTGACLLALLRLDAAPCAAFVGTFLDRGDPTLRELAALALGESRLPEALTELRTRWDAEPYKGAAEQVLLKGAALHRSEAAFDWLLSLVADGEHRIAERVLRDLTAYRGNERLRQRLAAALTARQDADLIALLARVWPAGAE